MNKRKQCDTEEKDNTNSSKKIKIIDNISKKQLKQLVFTIEGKIYFHFYYCFSGIFIFNNHFFLDHTGNVKMNIPDYKLKKDAIQSSSIQQKINGSKKDFNTVKSLKSNKFLKIKKDDSNKSTENAFIQSKAYPLVQNARYNYGIRNKFKLFKVNMIIWSKYNKSCVYMPAIIKEINENKKSLKISYFDNKNKTYSVKSNNWPFFKYNIPKEFNINNKNDKNLYNSLMILKLFAEKNNFNDISLVLKNIT